MRQTLGCKKVSDMHDQRVEIGPPFGAINRSHGIIAVRPRGEAINGFGRHRDCAPGTDTIRGADYCARIVRQDAIEFGRGHDGSPQSIAPKSGAHFWQKAMRHYLCAASRKISKSSAML